MSTSSKVSLVVIGAIALVVFYFVSGRRQPDAPAPQPAPKEAAAPVARPAPVAPVVSAPPAPPNIAPAMPAVVISSNATAKSVAPKLPAQRIPVKTLQTTLQQTGPSGDAQISCRLGVELIRCVRLDYRSAMLQQLRNQVAQGPTDTPMAIQKTKEIEDRARLLAEDRDICGGVAPQSSAREAWRHLYNAAQGGSVAAMSQFVRDPGMDPRDPEVAEGLETFKRMAPELLTGAIQGGDVKALWQGWFSLSTGLSATTPKVFERDPYRALVYAMVAVPFLDEQRAGQVNGSMIGLTRELGPERAAQARQEAETLRATSFANPIPFDWGPDNGESESVECLK